ncbi:PHD-domain-containing protein [Gigaspora margarita]|uniref:CXXC-type zinc finger protein 1 n=1 Tax=Gigaspora margarita TaxID=4874 RepID=A0A8H3ZZR0_GIGMA|nr:PHD-domain-containing protein [Gigaspora margarita]
MPLLAKPLIEPSISQVKTYSASDSTHQRQEMQPPQQQSTSSFNIMSILNPAPSPPSNRPQTVSGSLQQDLNAHPVLPPASSMTQQTYFQSSPHSQPQTPTFQLPYNNNLRLPPPCTTPTFPSFPSSSNSPVNIYGYTPQKSTFSPVGFNASSNGTPLSPVKTSPSTPMTNAPTVLQSSHVLIPNEISIPATPITAYNNRSPSLSPTIQEQDITASINKSNHHNRNSSEVNQVTVATTTPILSDSCGHLTKDQPPTPTLTPVEFIGQPIQKSGYLHQNLNSPLNEDSSELEQLATTALCELQNSQRREVIHNEEARNGRESDMFSDEGHVSHPASPFEERTPIKNMVSPISYESTTGSTPAPPQTDSEFQQYDYDEPMKEFIETTDSDSAAEEQSKSEFTRINKTSHVKGKDLQNKRRYKVSQKNHEEVSSDDTSPRQRKSGTRRSKTTPTKRKLSLTSDRSFKDSNKRQFRSRTTSNNSSRNTSPSLESTKNTNVDEMVIDESERVGEQLYCVCRSSDGQSFMIECDKCDEWFHGACVKISSEESLMVDKFYCPNCTAKGFKTSWKAEKCKYPPCKKPAKLTISKFCSVKCGVDFTRILLEKEERAAKMKQLLSKKNKDNKKGPIKRNVTNRTGQLEGGEKLKRIEKKEAKIKKELEEIETLNNVAGRSTERVQSESDQIDSDGSAQDIPCEFEKQSESDGPTHSAPICGYSPRFDWAIDEDDVKYAGDEICTIQKARCKKHRNWQSRKNMQLELAKVNKKTRLLELAGEKKLIKAQMRKRNDMSEAIINETIDHTAGCE